MASNERQGAKKRNVILTVFIVASIAYLSGFLHDLHDFARGFHDGYASVPTHY